MGGFNAAGKTVKKGIMGNEGRLTPQLSDGRLLFCKNYFLEKFFDLSLKHGKIIIKRLLVTILQKKKI